MAVSSGDPKLSLGVSHPTYQTAYELFTPNKSGQRLHPTYYRGCWHVVSRCLFLRYRHEPSVLIRAFSFRTKAVYNPKAFVLHAEWLDQACAHCPKFPTAASRRSLDRVSVPVWLIVLSDQLPVVALVRRYLTNKLIGREPLPKRKTFLIRPCDQMGVSGISSSFELLSQTSGQVAHVVLTRSPLTLPVYCYTMESVRLACVKHAASVRPEPGSNSPSRSSARPEGRTSNQRAGR